MRRQIILFAFIFVASLSVLPLTARASIPFFGPIIPSSYNVCPAGWGMFMTVINNIIELILTLGIVFVAPIVIAIAGFLYVLNPYSPSNIDKAKGILTHIIVGIIVMLAAWMIVDAVMAVLYNPSAAGGTWSSLITSNGDFCLTQAGALPGDPLNQAPLSGVSANGGVTTVNGQPTAQCSSSNTACSPAALQSTGLSATQANVMSCIAVTESSGNPGTPPYNTTHPGSNSTACGTFQITQTTWNKYASGACADFSTNCMSATCNLQVAKALVTNNGYSDWTCANCNSKAAACVQQYGG